MADEWAALAGARYLNLESFRRDGTGVRTPLWFAPSADGAVFYIYSVADSFKIKRLRRTPRCRIAACTMRGVPTGPWLDATATILAGQVTYRDGEPTDALPGRLLRGAQAAPARMAAE